MTEKLLAETKVRTISSCFQNGTNKERVRWSGFHSRNWRQVNVKTLTLMKETTRDWSDEKYNDNGWNSITRGYGIYTEGGSGVKVKFTLNTFSVLSHERSGAHETLLEKLWKEERGQYGLTIKKIINWKNQWSKTDSESGNGKLNQDSKQQEAIESNKAYTMAKVAFEEYDSWRRIQYLGKLDFTRNAKIWKNGAEKVLTKEEMELINEFLQV